MSYYYWLMPSLTLWAISIGYLSNMSQMHGGRWAFYLYLFSGLVPMWTIISVYSKNLVLDGAIFDVYGFVVFMTTLIYLGSAEMFGPRQFIGLGIILFGFILMQKW